MKTATISTPDNQIKSLQSQKATAQQAIATIEAEIINLDNELSSSISEFSGLSTEGKAAELDRQQELVERRKNKQGALAQEIAKSDRITRTIMDCLSEQTRVEAMGEAERAQHNATLERVRENKEAIATAEKEAHELEEQINGAVAVLADAIPQWRLLMNEINRGHGTIHSLLPDEYAKHRYCNGSVEELKLPKFALYDYPGFTVRIDRTKI